MNQTTETTKRTREEIISGLQDQLNKLNEESNGQYTGTIDRPHGSMCECNFGGMLIILGKSGDSAVIWSDFSGTSINEELTEVEIEYFVDPDDDDEENNLKAGFIHNQNTYFLDEFMIVN